MHEEHQEDIVELYQEALDHYQSDRFSEALVLFRKVLDIDRHYKRAGRYASACEAIMKEVGGGTPEGDAPPAQEEEVEVVEALPEIEAPIEEMEPPAHGGGEGEELHLEEEEIQIGEAPPAVEEPVEEIEAPVEEEAPVEVEEPVEEIELPAEEEAPAEVEEPVEEIELPAEEGAPAEGEGPEEEIELPTEE